MTWRASWWSFDRFSACRMSRPCGPTHACGEETIAQVASHNTASGDHNGAAKEKTMGYFAPDRRPVRPPRAKLLSARLMKTILLLNFNMLKTRPRVSGPQPFPPQT
jgi:hypothetical protein